MERQDQETIEALRPTNPELDELWREHLKFEEQLEEMNQRVYLTPEEEIERKALQKQKLAGRDRIESILAEHRAGENS